MINYLIIHKEQQGSLHLIELVIMVLQSKQEWQVYVPLGKYKNPIICNSSNLRNVSLALRYSKATIKASDYKEVLLENAKEGDFIYLDPPYNPVSSTAYFTKYTNSGFNNRDQKELAYVFTKLNDRNCEVLLSNSSTP